MIYPKELVHNFGAKAGILMYIKNHLSEIPQVDMVVKTPNDAIDHILKKADDFPILYPRLLRSSAVAELDGYEGWFPTIEVLGPNSWLFERNYPNMSLSERLKYTKDELIMRIERIQESTQELKKSEPGKHEHLPDNISVIIAEKSPSSIVGTFVKHPNQDGLYIISTSTAESLNGYDPEHSAFTFRPKQGIKSFEYFTKKGIEESSYISDKAKERLYQELEQVVLWHDKISNLPEMDSGWSYQIEFGLDPICLYQVRPFKEIKKADFRLNKNKEYQKPLVFGITSKDGINIRAEMNVWERHCNEEIINPEYHPSLHFDTMRNANKHDRIPNLKANILTESRGILAHDDIGAIRQADVTGLYVLRPNIKIIHGNWYNIKSDGRSIQIKEL